MQHPNDKVYIVGSGKIFVFGSNLAGIHGAGAALYARMACGALQRVGEGHMGMAYAIPTKDENLMTLPLDAIQDFVQKFITYAQCHTEMQFFVTRIGCGLAGYTDREIAPLFKEAPANCELPHGWDKPETLP